MNDAAVRKFPGLADDLTKPNNLLGIQYARTILQYDLPMEILPFPRDQDQPVSATAIRGEIAGGHAPSHIPEAERPALLRLLRRAPSPITGAMTTPVCFPSDSSQRSISSGPASFQRDWRTGG